MSDDNPKRAARLAQLVTDCQLTIADSKKLYEDFLKSNAELNTKLAAVYSKANLPPPDSSDQDLLKGTAIGKQVATTDKEVRVAGIVTDMVGTTTMLEMAPAATAYLVDAGILTEAEAGTAIASMLGYDITVGGAVGGIVGAVVVGIVGGVITGAIGVFTHQSTRADLHGGIASMKAMRLSAELSREKLRCVGDVVEACKSACDALMQVGIVDEAAIDGMIKGQAGPALKKLQAIDRNTAIGNLYTMDVNRGSWMQDG